MTGTKQWQQIIDDRANLPEVTFDVREGRRPDRDDDVVGASGIGGSVGQRQIPLRQDPIQHLLRAGLVKRHLLGAKRTEDVIAVIDAQHVDPPVGEAQGKREPDAAQADDCSCRALARLGRRKYYVGE